MTILSTHLKVFWQLLLRDLILFKPEYKGKAINCLIWTTITTLVFASLMPNTSSATFGTFILMSGSATWGFFSTIKSVATVIGDLNGDKTIFYELTLPLPQWMVFAKIGVINAIISFSTAIFIIPIGKLCLWNSIDLTQFHAMKFYFIIFLACLFYGFFSLLIASIIKSIYKLDNIWTRIVFPMWFLGCYQFTWQNMYDISPKLAYLNLLNPVTYAMEGARAVSLDPSLSLPYWNCVAALCGFIIIAAFVGIKVMKKRLDCL